MIPWIKHYIIVLAIIHLLRYLRRGRGFISFVDATISVNAVLAIVLAEYRGYRDVTIYMTFFIFILGTAFFASNYGAIACVNFWIDCVMTGYYVLAYYIMVDFEDTLEWMYPYIVDIISEYANICWNWFVEFVYSYASALVSIYFK